MRTRRSRFLDQVTEGLGVEAVSPEPLASAPDLFPGLDHPEFRAWFERVPGGSDARRDLPITWRDTIRRHISMDTKVHDFLSYVGDRYGFDYQRHRGRVVYAGPQPEGNRFGQAPSKPFLSPAELRKRRETIAERLPIFAQRGPAVADVPVMPPQMPSRRSRAEIAARRNSRSVEGRS